MHGAGLIHGSLHAGSVFVTPGRILYGHRQINIYLYSTNKNFYLIFFQWLAEHHDNLEKDRTYCRQLQNNFVELIRTRDTRIDPLVVFLGGTSTLRGVGYYLSTCSTDMHYCFNCTTIYKVLKLSFELNWCYTLTLLDYVHYLGLRSTSFPQIRNHRFLV